MRRCVRYTVTDPATVDQIGVWVDPVGPNNTHVSVVVLDDTALPGPDESGVHEDILSAINLVKNRAPVDKRP